MCACACYKYSYNHFLLPILWVKSKKIWNISGVICILGHNFLSCLSASFNQIGPLGLWNWQWAPERQAHVARLESSVHERRPSSIWSVAHLLKGSALTGCNVFLRSRRNQLWDYQIQYWRHRKLLTICVLFDLVCFVGLFQIEPPCVVLLGISLCRSSWP